MTTESAGPLDRVRVLEIAEGVGAPFCGRLFADYGADVVKVEPPHRGDVTRSWGPFRGDVQDAEASGTFVVLNAGKRSLCLDPTVADDRAVLHDLIREADVVITGQTPNELRAMGLEYDELTTMNPSAVMVSVTAYGLTGPYSNWRACDLNAFHLSGAGWRYCGRPGEAPLEQGTFAADYFGGYVAAGWGLAALYGRERLGGGQLVDVSCAQVLAGLFTGAQNAGPYAATGRYETRTGVGMKLGAPATIFPCADGFVWVMALEPGQWEGLRAVMGDPEWARSEVFADMLGRATNADVLNPLIGAWTATRTKAEIMQECQARRCPATAVFTIDEVATSPHLIERGAFAEIDHPVLGRVRVLAAPVGVAGGTRAPARPAPLLGEHQRDTAAPWAPRRAGSGGSGSATAVTPTRDGPLSGLKVANFGWGWVGPAAGQMLAWLGADVVKIESHVRVDLNRTLRPFGGDIESPDRSIQNHSTFAGNGSVTLDLKDPRGVELARWIVAACDVVLENFAPGVMDRFGLGYDVLRSVREDVIMVSMPAAGSSGPLSNVRTYGQSLCSITGLDSVTGYFGESPLPFENAFADPLGGVIGGFATLLALAHRRDTGAGQHIDCSQQEGVLAFMGPAFMDYELNGRVGGPLGNRHPSGAASPHGVFPVAGDDQWITIAVFDDDEWVAVVATLGRPEWALDARFAAAAGRLEHLDELHRRLGDTTRGHDGEDLVRRLQAVGVAAAPVLDIPRLLTNEHLCARPTFAIIEHPLGFSETIFAPYAQVSGFDIDLQPGPVMGRDNERVFKEWLGLDATEYEGLVHSRVIY